MLLQPWLAVTTTLALATAVFLLVWRVFGRRARRPGLRARLHTLADDDIATIAYEKKNKVFGGVYPRGFSRVALDELVMAGAVLLPDGHLETHAAILFQLETDGGPSIELGCFTLLFEVICKPCCLAAWPLSLAELRAGMQSAISANASTWRDSICVPWRASCIRKTCADQPGTVKSPAIEQELANVVTPCLRSPAPLVDLKGYAVEAIVFLSDGVDLVKQAQGSGVPAASKETLMLLGVRSVANGLVNPAKLCVSKGSEVHSRAEDAVAFCVAYRAVAFLQPYLQSPSETLTASDPMCGVGTYLLALRWILERRASACQHARVRLLGSDVEHTSITQASVNLHTSHAQKTAIVSCTGDIARTPTGCASRATSTLSVELEFTKESTSEWCARMVELGGLDLVLVDPPWGQRHSSFSKVMKDMHAWSRDWANALKPGGRALVVTIRTKQFENEILKNLLYRRLLFLEEALQFDNKGYWQCKLFILRKPTAEEKSLDSLWQ